MKRSRSVRLILLGGLSAGALAGCGPSGGNPAPITDQNFYTNNYFVAGVGYYHAPFRAWYPLPYNHFDAQNQRYFCGGQWQTAPHQSITNISSPLPEAARHAQTLRADVTRGGFGGISHGLFIGS